MGSRIPKMIVQQSVNLPTIRYPDGFEVAFYSPSSG